MSKGDRIEFSGGEGMSEWRECKLGDFAEIQTGPFGSQLHASDYVFEGIPSIMPTNIGNRLDIKLDNIVCIKEKDANRLEKYLVQENDIVYSRRGDVEKCAFITNQEAGWLCGTGCLRVRFTSDKLLPKFCAYYLSTDDIKSWVSGNAVGTTMPNLNSSILRRVPLTLPPLPEQKAIAAILSSLDDKIDLLHRQNKTLEAIAETLFRQWFIEEAQDDWEEGALGDEFDFIMGQSPSGSSFNEEGIGLPMFQGNADFGFRFPRERVYTTEPTRLAKKLDTLISVRAPVGSQNMAHKECCIGRGVAAFRYRRNSGSYTYTYFKLRSLMEEIKKFNDEGTVFGSISKSDFEALKTTIPPNELVEKYEQEASPVNDKIIANCKQIQTLEKLRDTLLPKLMSGEVRVEL
jgi:type I restriction enzyme, S subunit